MNAALIEEKLGLPHSGSRPCTLVLLTLLLPTLVSIMCSFSPRGDWSYVFTTVVSGPTGGVWEILPSVFGGSFLRTGGTV